MGKGPLGLRQNRLRVDELKRLVSDLQISIDHMSQQSKKLNDEVPESLPPIGAQRDGYLAYGSYIRELDKRKSRVDMSLDEMVGELESRQEELEHAQSELERLEVLYAKRLPRPRRGRRAKEKTERISGHLETIFG